jgi:hypothetical protein
MGKLIEEGKLKLDDIVFIYSQPVEEAVIGMIVEITYPIAKIEVINKKEKEIQEINLNKNIPLTLLDEEQIKKYLTDKQRSYIEEKDEITDIFEGMY